MVVLEFSAATERLPAANGWTKHWKKLQLAS